MKAMIGPVWPLPFPALALLIGAPGAGQDEALARWPAQWGGQVLRQRDFGRGAGAQSSGALASLLSAAGTALQAGQGVMLEGDFTLPAPRRAALALARAEHLPAVALVLDLARSELPPASAEAFEALRRTGQDLEAEGFSLVYRLHSRAETQAVTLRPVPLAPDRRDLRGPFDLIGDVHGCLPELRELLAALGYRSGPDRAAPEHPGGRQAVFLGDLTDRGPDSAGVLALVRAMVGQGSALAVLGNHDEKLRRALKGKAVQTGHGLAQTLAELSAEPERAGALALLETLPSHLVLDGGALVAAHAGLPERFQGRDSGAVRRFTLYGDIDGRTDEAGRPVRADWAATYGGSARVVYGHSPVSEPRWVNRTLNIDTGCAFGGQLTALRYPELELVQVRAHRAYADYGRPFL